jgi:hypothetical protein
VRPPLAFTSRQTVDGARPSFWAIIRNDRPAANSRETSSRLLERAQQAGDVHKEATADDLLRLVIGIALATDDRKQAARMLDLAQDGLRHR